MGGGLCFINADYLSGCAALQGLLSNWTLQHQQKPQSLICKDSDAYISEPLKDNYNTMIDN